MDRRVRDEDGEGEMEHRGVGLRGYGGVRAEAPGVWPGEGAMRNLGGGTALGGELDLSVSGIADCSERDPRRKLNMSLQLRWGRQGRVVGMPQAGRRFLSRSWVHLISFTITS